MSNYKKLFEQLLPAPEDTCLKLQFYVIHLKLVTILVERRDFLKRCQLHLNLLAKVDGSKYYGRQSCFLLKEIVGFMRKKSLVFDHIDNAIGYYKLHSDCSFHSLEKEFYSVIKRRFQFNQRGAVN